MAPFAQKRALAHLQPGVGRPSEYKAEYCELVIDYMARGFSLTAFAGHIRMSRDAVYDWMGRHSEFSNAVARGRAARVTALEGKLLTARYGAQASTAIFALRNAEPNEWRDMKHTTTDVNVRVETLSDAQLFAVASGKSLSERRHD